MTQQPFSDRVCNALEVIRTKELTRAGLRHFYANAVRVTGITDAEREAVIAALETRIRISAPREAKALFGPKDAEARTLLARIHDALAAELDLSGNTVGAGVKTGGDMISGESHVSVYISYKGADWRHVTLGVLQRTPDAEPVLNLRLFQIECQIASTRTTCTLGRPALRQRLASGAGSPSTTTIAHTLPMAGNRPPWSTSTASKPQAVA